MTMENNHPELIRLASDARRESTPASRQKNRRTGASYRANDCTVCTAIAILSGLPGLANLACEHDFEGIGSRFWTYSISPDLMPSDITGTDILEVDQDTGRRRRFMEGPIFTNLLLADEINRTPPKT